MADYWKSNERHFCKFCNCWLAANKVSIELHERGNNHKNNVKAKLDQVRRDKAEKEREAKAMNATLSDIERAAYAAYQRDVANEASGSSTAGSDPLLPSKLKRPANEPVQIQLKKPKFVLKTPRAQPVFVPIEEAKKKEEVPPPSTEGTWYESKTENQESFYWNDTTGASTWTAPPVYLSIEEQRAKGLNV